MLTPRLLANKLRVKLKYLTFLSKTLLERSSDFYTKVRIPKGKGKYRTVYKVSGNLDSLHRKIKELLEAKLPSSGTSFAYERGIKLSDTVQRMQGSPLVVSVDFKNHFTSVTMWQVTEMLKSSGFTPKVAFLLARLCCITEGTRSFLPQGSRVSPLLSNRVCEHLLDGPLKQEFPEAEITRYSDNLYLCFSTNKVKGRDVITRIKSVVKATTGWRCHKCRIMPYYRRQRGLGLVLNKKANMPKEKYHNLKALLFNLAHNDQNLELSRAQQYGIDCTTVAELLEKLKCQLVYWKQFLTPNRHSKLTNLIQMAEGRLNETINSQ